MQGKSEERYPTHAGKRGCCLRLGGHPPAEGFASGDQGKPRCKTRRLGDGCSNRSMTKLGRIWPPAALFHVWKLITQRANAARPELDRNRSHERMFHPGAGAVRQYIAGVSTGWQLAQRRDAVCVIDGYRHALCE